MEKYIKRNVESNPKLLYALGKKTIEVSIHFRDCRFSVNTSLDFAIIPIY